MKILLAADGSPYTTKAVEFVVAHEGLCGPNGELIVLNVQPPVPPGVKGMVGADQVTGYHRDEAEKVLEPLKKFLAGYKIPFRCVWVVGSAAEEIAKMAQTEKADLVVMGTHGYGLVGRFVMGSVAQRVIAQCETPVLLVK